MTTRYTPDLGAWFGGPKAENAQWFNAWLLRIAEDYSAWRRNYFPEDGAVIDSALRREHEDFTDRFEDKLLELLARLKGDVPSHSPRYAAHMIAEATLPSIAGYFAAMLYNPNNVTAEVAPVTVRLELEAGRMLSEMIGYDLGPRGSWAHLCSGGTTANIEALWAARSVKYLPLVLRDVRRALGLADPRSHAPERDLLAMSPAAALAAYEEVGREVANLPNPTHAMKAARAAAKASAANVVEHGLVSVCGVLASRPILLVPESHHYCFEKSMDLLGMGRASLRSVEVDANFRMRTDALRDALDAIDTEGNHTLAVVGVLGSTEEGSIDPLDELVALRRERENAGKPSFWLHADGAYGGYLRSITVPHRGGLGEAHAHVKVGAVERDIPLNLPEHHACRALEDLAQCDSVTIDPHKLGYIPYPAGAVCFRSNLVKPLMRQAAPYLDEAPQPMDVERTSDSVGLYVLEGSKPGAAAAAVWLSHSLIPLNSGGHGRIMKENIRNACELHALLEGYKQLAGPQGVRAVCLCPPSCNIVCYAFVPAAPGASLASINALNRELHRRFSLSAGQRVYEQEFFVSRTTLTQSQYKLRTLRPFLARLGVQPEEYEDQGVFLLRSVLMNPWYAHAKRKGRYFLAEMAGSLHAEGAKIVESGKAAARNAPPKP